MRKVIDKDIRMLTCVESMLDKMEYAESAEDPDVAYINIDHIKLMFKNGEYTSWSLLSPN